MKKFFVFVVVSALGLLFSSSFAMAQNFRVGKLPEPGNSSEWISNKPARRIPPAATTTERPNLRNGSACGILETWDLVLPELSNAKRLEPARGFTLGTQENDGNIVVMITLSLLSKKRGGPVAGWNEDLEYALLEFMSYGNNQFDRYRWYGWLEQIVGASYQIALEMSRGWTFQEAFEKFTDGQVEWVEFEKLYARVARHMNRYLKLKNPYPRHPDSEGYYTHFQVTLENREQIILAVKKVFKKLGWSMFENDNFFDEPATPSIVIYDTPEKFCK